MTPEALRLEILVLASGADPGRTSRIVASMFDTAEVLDARPIDLSSAVAHAAADVAHTAKDPLGQLRLIFAFACYLVGSGLGKEDGSPQDGGCPEF